jgi:hypothetical protein
VLLALVFASALAAAEPSQAPAAEPAPPTAPAAQTPASIEDVLEKLRKASPGDGDEQGAEPPPAPTPPPPPLRRPSPYADLDARAYADAILASARTAQAMQGPLDGGWALSSEDGRRIYSFRFADRGQGMSQAEGAWRDLQSEAGQASGFISQVGYDGEKLMLRFYEAGPEDLVVLTLKPVGAGAWPGELWRKGAVTRVMLARQ